MRTFKYCFAVGLHLLYFSVVILTLGYGLKLVDLVANLRLSFLIPTFYRWENHSLESISDLFRGMLLGSGRTKHLHCSVQSLLLILPANYRCFPRFFSFSFSIIFASSNHSYNLKKITWSKMTQILKKKKKKMTQILISSPNLYRT